MSGTSASCPNSPRRSRLAGGAGEAADAAGASSSDYLKGLTEDEVVEVGISLSSSLGSNSSMPRPVGIHRSASTTNAARPRTAPAGLYSYTGEIMGRVCDLDNDIIDGVLFPGSAPPSVHGSLVNINASSQGTAIYVGYTPTARGSVSASSYSLGQRPRSSSQASFSSATTPSPSPQSSPRRVRSKKLVQ